MAPNDSSHDPADIPRFISPGSFDARLPPEPICPDLPPPPLLRPPPLAHAENEPEMASTSTGRGWAVAVFVVVAVLPTLFFCLVGFSDDDTATASATGAVLWLSGFELVAGCMAATIAWSVSRGPSSAGRSIGLSLLLVLAGMWGLVTGFLGGTALSMQRHPTWDDA